MTEDKFLELVHKHQVQIYQHTSLSTWKSGRCRGYNAGDVHQGVGIPCQITTEDRACVVTEMYAESLF